MKIKSLIVVFIVVSLFLFMKHSTTYSGKYYAGNTDKQLVLNADSTFSINIYNYKTSTTINGTYSISNNEIKLLPKAKNEMWLIKDISSGKITGSIITFTSSSNASPIIFTKF